LKWLLVIVLWAVSVLLLVVSMHCGSKTTFACIDGVMEIPWVDESSEQELLSLLGDWYEPKMFDSVFSLLPSDAVTFSL